MSAELHQTAQQHCAVAGISRSMFFNALKVRRNGCNGLNDLVQSGDVSMNLALEVARLDHAGQPLILAEFPTIKLGNGAGFVVLARLAHEQGGANGERS